MHIELWQWILGAGAAVLVGISKTGIPGTGILVVPMLAYAFGGRQSVGIMLPMLIFADCFAVLWYRRHVQWDKLIGLLPWVVAGLVVGAIGLWITGRLSGSVDVIGRVIGVLVLLMLVINLLQGRLGNKLTPTSKIGIAATGTAAGFTTMVSNAAGPIMSIYMSAHKLPKKEFIGTLAWYFFLINLSKVPVFLVLSAVNPQKPMITLQSFKLDLVLFPVILVGVFAGKWLLPRISQKAFDVAVLGLAGLAAIKLIIG